MLDNHSRKVEYWNMTFKTFQNNVEMKHVSKEDLLSVLLCFNGIMQTFFLTHTRILVTSPLGTDFPHPITTDHLLMVRALLRVQVRPGAHSARVCHHVQDKQALHPRQWVSQHQAETKYHTSEIHYVHT